jgi:hypothetical protein
MVGGLNNCSCVIGILKQFWCSFRQILVVVYETVTDKVIFEVDG